MTSATSQHMTIRRTLSAAHDMYLQPTLVAESFLVGRPVSRTSPPSATEMAELNANGEWLMHRDEDAKHRLFERCTIAGTEEEGCDASLFEAFDFVDWAEPKVIVATLRRAKKGKVPTEPVHRSFSSTQVVVKQVDGDWGLYLVRCRASFRCSAKHRRWINNELSWTGQVALDVSPFVGVKAPYVLSEVLGRPLPTVSPKAVLRAYAMEAHIPDADSATLLVALRPSEGVSLTWGRNCSWVLQRLRLDSALLVPKCLAADLTLVSGIPDRRFVQGLELAELPTGVPRLSSSGSCEVTRSTSPTHRHDAKVFGLSAAFEERSSNIVRAADEYVCRCCLQDALASSPLSPPAVTERRVPLVHGKSLDALGAELSSAHKGCAVFVPKHIILRDPVAVKSTGLVGWQVVGATYARYGESAR